MNTSKHTPLHRLVEGYVQTAGRFRNRNSVWFLSNARTKIPAKIPERRDISNLDGALARIAGYWDGQNLQVDRIDKIRDEPTEQASGRRLDAGAADIFRRRQNLYASIRNYFENRDFIETPTPYCVREPGTDLHITPLEVRFPGRETDGAMYLHTSPEFQMKRLLAEGFERIFQVARVWRGDEPTVQHRREFDLLEWYRAWEPLEAIIRDVERIAGVVAGSTQLSVPGSVTPTGQSRQIDLTPPIERLAVADAFESVCGFNILDAQTFETLFAICKDKQLLPKSSLKRQQKKQRWDSLFFELEVTHLDPFLERKGAVVVTDWPARLGMLARKDPNDDRIAQRFELFAAGIELANGFQELTDPEEQKRRFARELEMRRKRDKPVFPLPQRFIDVLKKGFPPSAGVAMGLDRLLMLQMNRADIGAVFPLGRP